MKHLNNTSYILITEMTVKEMSEGNMSLFDKIVKNKNECYGNPDLILINPVDYVELVKDYRVPDELDGMRIEQRLEVKPGEVIIVECKTVGSPLNRYTVVLDFRSTLDSEQIERNIYNDLKRFKGLQILSLEREND